MNQLREHDREMFSGIKEFMREMCQVLQPVPAPPAQAPPVPDIRLQNVERAIAEVRETQQATRQDILRFMNELRRDFNQAWNQQPEKTSGESRVV